MGRRYDMPCAMLEDYTGPIDSTLSRRMKGQIRRVSNLLVESVSSALTMASLTVSPIEDNEVLVFSKNTSSRLQLDPCDSDDGPALVAFFLPRATAEKMVVGHIRDTDTVIPPSHRLISIVTVEDNSDSEETCIRYLQSLSSYRPASYLQHGFVIGAHGFQFVSVGLDDQIMWSKIAWNHPSVILKLCACVKLIRDEAMRPLRPAVPKLMDVVTMKSRTIGLYSSQIGSHRFHLLPILSRSRGRKPFVALGVTEDGQHARVFKYSWYKTADGWREHKLLRKLSDVPGVVHLDDEFSEASLVETVMESNGTDEEDSRTRGLLVLKTIGYPLCACESVLEFLEAMYDLLEVLRYLVQEKNILHRDISWSNVLIRPREPSTLPHNAKGVFKSDGQGDEKGIPHTYRFVSDIFEESEWNVRVALADFDHASEIQTGEEAELKDKAGTQMFMAEDVLLVRKGFAMGSFSMLSETVKDEALDTQGIKYADPREKEEWDGFYQNLADLQWKISPRIKNFTSLEESFRHGAVHDAESVFYLCLLFFNRLWLFDEHVDISELDALEMGRGELFEVFARRKCSFGTVRFQDLERTNFGTAPELDPFYIMLITMLWYVRVPWYNAASTGRRERHEFHLHDFMQRLLLKEIMRLRASGNPLFIEENPLPANSFHSSAAHIFNASATSSTISSSHDSTRQEREKCRDGMSRAYNGHGCMVSRGILTASARCVRKGKENGAKNHPCKKRKNRSFDEQNSGGLVLPVYRPKGMPESYKEKFHDPTGIFWDIYWWKVREKLWVTAK